MREANGERNFFDLLTIGPARALCGKPMEKGFFIFLPIGPARALCEKSMEKEIFFIFFPLDPHERYSREQGKDEL
jgi:hypothetical protein